MTKSTIENRIKKAKEKASKSTTLTQAGEQREELLSIIDEQQKKIKTQRKEISHYIRCLASSNVTNGDALKIIEDQGEEIKGLEAEKADAVKIIMEQKKEISRLGNE